jgi:hypothetical protein
MSLFFPSFFSIKTIYTIRGPDSDGGGGVRFRTSEGLTRQLLRARILAVWFNIIVSVGGPMVPMLILSVFCSFGEFIQTSTECLMYTKRTMHIMEIQKEHES